jgi:hypothetical protein
VKYVAVPITALFLTLGVGLSSGVSPTADHKIAGDLDGSACKTTNEAGLDLPQHTTLGKSCD